MKRSEKRQAARQAGSIVKTAKIDMLEWVEEVGRVPSREEILAWQAGYLSGINRMAQHKEKE